MIHKKRRYYFIQRQRGNHWDNDWFHQQSMHTTLMPLFHSKKDMEFRLALSKQIAKKDKVRIRSVWL